MLSSLNSKKLFSAFLIIFLSIFCITSKGFPTEKEQWDLGDGIIFDVYYRALQPGEAIFILSKSNKIISADAVVFNKKFPFYNSKENSVFTIIGIDLTVKPDYYPILLIIKTDDGQKIEKRKILAIKDKYFPIRKIWVDEKFVTPPPNVIDRIIKEQKILNEIYNSITPQCLFKNEFQPPLPAVGKKNFGEKRLFNLKPRSRHTGIDIPAPLGAEVKAANSGKVVLAQDLYFAGKTVIIDHGIGLFSLYCHLSEINVEKGQLVKKGEIIGKVGATGRVTGPHLHWGVKLKGIPIDPYSLLELPLSILY